MENKLRASSKLFTSTCEKSSNEDTNEESGWTVYFDELLVVNKNDHKKPQASFSSDKETSSLLSDAGSAVAENCSGRYKLEGGLSNGGRLKKLSDKTSRIIGELVDDALEDTASSRVNVPGVKRPFSNTHEEEGVVLSSVEEKTEKGFIGGYNGANTELNKRVLS